MKTLAYLTAGLIVVILCTPPESSFAQKATIDFGSQHIQITEPSSASDIDDGVVGYKERVIGQCRVAVENDNTVGPVRKRFRLRMLERPDVQSRIFEMVTPKALESGALRVVVSDDFDPENAIQLDLDKLLELFEKLLPFIFMLLELFGSYGGDFSCVA